MDGPRDGFPWTKEMRLRRSVDFQRVWTEGKSWVHPLFVVRGCPNTLGYTRVGITASRKIGGAVKRNRARRLLREASRILYREMASGWDIVLVARRSLLNAKESQVEAALRVVLCRAGLLVDVNGCNEASA